MAFDLDQFNIGIVSDFLGRVAATVGSQAGPAGSAIAEIFVNNGTNQALTFLKEKQNQKKSSIVEICNQKISKDSPCDEFKPLIIATVEICFENYKEINEKIYREFDPNKLAKDLVEKYIFGDPELESLSGILTDILSVVIQQYLEDLVKDPNELVSLISSLQQIDSGQDKTIEELKANLMHLKEFVEQLSKQQALSSSSVKDRYEEYRSAWNERMFLHRGPRRPKLLLSDVYQVPRYDEDFTDPNDSSNNIHRHANTDLDQKLRDALNAREENKMLLVLGQPGSGKSTLITYLLNKHTVRDTRKIRVFRFRELGIENWNIEPSKLPELILSHLSLLLDALSDSVLILDGLDEVPMSTNHKSFMDALYKYWCSFDGVKNFSLFITCRLSRIPSDDIEHMSCITVKLCSLDSSQINVFRNAYYLKTGEKRTRFKLSKRNKDALGIPIILYMVLASHIDIGNKSSMVDVYDKLFSTKDVEHSLYLRPHENNITLKLAAEIEQTHSFCKYVAIVMWDKHPQEAYADSADAQKIWKRIKSDSKDKETTEHLHDVLSEQYFIEGVESHDIYFVHRSIYEYFVAVSIFDWIQNLYVYSPSSLFSPTKSDAVSKLLVSFANIIGAQYLGDFPEIRDFLFYMLQKGIAPSYEEWWDDFFMEFLVHGLLNVSNNSLQNSSKLISDEYIRFINILLLTQEYRNEKIPYPLLSKIPESVGMSSLDLIRAFSFYIHIPNIKTANFALCLQNTNWCGANLAGANLEGANLAGANLVGANLESAYLAGANLENAHLEHAQLEMSHLAGANLAGANLEGANLAGTNLPGLHLESTNLKYAHLAGAYLAGAYLAGAYLENAHLGNTNLKGVHLKGATLFKAELEFSINLEFAEFDGLSISELNQAFLPVDFRLPERYEVGKDGIIHLKNLTSFTAPSFHV